MIGHSLRAGGKYARAAERVALVVATLTPAMRRGSTVRLDPALLSTPFARVTGQGPAFSAGAAVEAGAWPCTGVGSPHPEQTSAMSSPWRSDRMVTSR